MLNLHNISRNHIPGYREVKSWQVFIAAMFILIASGATAQWITQSPVPTNLDVRGMGAPTTESVFIATDDNSFDNSGALFGSNDGGTTWNQLDVRGSPQEVGEFSIGIVAAEEDLVITPQEVHLGQNFPNPFYPMTTIHYSIPEEGLVNLKVYNIVGEEEAVLVNKYMQAGHYEAHLNAAELSDGFYFYSLHLGNIVQTKRMVVSK